MAQILVRNLDDDVVRSLKHKARVHGRSLEAEVRAILEEHTRVSREEFWEFAAASRRSTAGRVTGDTTDLIREDRDR
jgi:antitoxin FitA